MNNTTKEWCRYSIVIFAGIILLYTASNSVMHYLICKCV